MPHCSADLVDALPYIDQGYDDSAREAALALIEEECKRYRPTKNYLDYLALPKFEAFETDVMKTEFERVSNRQPMEPLNMKRYELPGPAAGKLTDVSSWIEAVENSQAQLEHQATRMENLELMSEYGADAFKAYIYVLQRMVEVAQKQMTELRKQIQEINFERKKSQVAAGDQLKRLEQSWVGLITKNYEIERVIDEMETENKPFRQAPTAE